MNSLRVGFLSSQNYLDRNAWSGTLYSMYQALKKKAKVINLGSPYQPFPLRRLAIFSRSSNCFPSIGSYAYITKKKEFVSLVEKQLSKTPCDIIFAPAVSEELYFIRTDIPIVYLSDVTHKLYEKHYLLNWDREEREWKNKQEEAAISKSAKLIYSSEWAAKSAISDYHADTSKVVVIPFGANIDVIPTAVKVTASKKSSSRCQLLFIGKDWHRKGGNIAYETLIALLEQGVNAELVIVGAIPPDAAKHRSLRVIPFLNKNSFWQRKQFYELLLESHFLLFPTRADCSPIVICEANAFGLPAVTTEVGGIPTIVKNGKNGYRLPLSASGKDFAELIARVFSNPTSYKQLVHSSREEYDQRLNWNEWAEKLCIVFRNLLN